MPRNLLHTLLTSAAVAMVLAGSVLLAPAWRTGADVEPAASVTEATAAGVTVTEERAWEVRGGQLSAALTGYAAGAAPFAVALIDNRTGRSFDFHGDEAFESASIAKVDILAGTLLRAQDEGRELTDRELRLATRMIGVSSNDAATALHDALGAASGLSATNARIGLERTVPSASWGLTTTTPKDQALLTRSLLTPGEIFTDYSRETARTLMTSIDPDQDWGVSAAAAEGEEVALKNGWLSRDTENGAWIVNSVGRITDDDTDLTLVVLSHGNAGYQAGVTHVENVARLTRRQLGL